MSHAETTVQVITVQVALLFHLINVEAVCCFNLFILCIWYNLVLIKKGLLSKDILHTFGGGLIIIYFS